jgi:hypothetical protein
VAGCQFSVKTQGLKPLSFSGFGGTAEAVPFHKPLLLLRLFGGLFWGGFLFCLRLFCFWLGLVFFGVGRLYLLRLCFFLGKVGGLEALPAKSDFGDADGSEVLTMSTKLLVLLFALVMEDQDLGAASLFDDLADYAGIGLISDLTFFAGNGDYGELDLSVGSGELLDANDVSGRYPVLLSTCADHRVHTFASVNVVENRPVGEALDELRSLNVKLKIGRTLALPRALLISLLAVFFRRGASAAGQASPERVGEYRQTQVFYRGLWRTVKQNGIGQ